MKSGKKPAAAGGATSKAATPPAADGAAAAASKDDARQRDSALHKKCRGPTRSQQAGRQARRCAGGRGAPPPRCRCRCRCCSLGQPRCCHQPRLGALQPPALPPGCPPPPPPPKRPGCCCCCRCAPLAAAQPGWGRAWRRQAQPSQHPARRCWRRRGVGVGVVGQRAARRQAGGQLAVGGVRVVGRARQARHLPPPPCASSMASPAPQGPRCRGCARGPAGGARRRERWFERTPAGARSPAR